MVSVLVSGKKEIEEPAKRISNSGEISLPLIGNVQVSGMDLDELVTRLTTLYKEYFVQPQVVVDFVKGEDSDMVSPWGYVTVLGRVKNPGRVSIPPTQDVTISGAIQKAGGLATSAKDSAIRVTRRLPDGTAAQFEVDLRSVGSRGRVSDDLILKPGDGVFVPEMIF
jgi:polysaccharide export outer membrane protein